MERKKIIYPKLSYKVVGIAFEVFNKSGFGRSEKYYQRAFEEELKNSKINYEKEKVVSINYKGIKIGNYFLDFLVDDKIIVELKVRQRLGYVHINQVLGYLKETGYKLAIIIYFTRDGVKYRRILNTD